MLNFLRSPVLVLLGLLMSTSAEAQLRNYSLRFDPPADARVVGFHVYVSANSMSYADWRDNINFIPPVDANRVATYPLTGLEAFDDVFLTMKSYDGAGVESGFSNELIVPALAQQCTATSCNDSNPCTRDSCTTTGCVFDPAPLRGTTCSDGNSTTFNDVCSASGSCAGTPGQCNADADCPASTNACTGPRVCSNHMCVAGAARADGTTCSDGSASTKYDICESGTCRGYACGSDAQCDDLEGCNGVERCSSRSCVGGTPMACGDGNVCNGSESCRNSTCVAGSAMQCSLEGGPCFDAFCDAAQGCRVQTHPDGTTCTTATSGLAGQCASGLCVSEATPPPADAEEPPVSCDTAFGPARLVRQALTSAPETSRKIVWSAPLNPIGAVLDYRLNSSSRWTRVRAAPESSSGCDAVWSVKLTGLAPRSRYLYRVSGASASGRVYSESYMLYTGPTDRSQRFRFAFLASNGLKGTPQSPQATNVLAQVRGGSFPLVLGGGGYTLSTEAIAAGVAPTAAQAVDMWKRQAGGMTANSMFAPVLGDTEVESFMHAENATEYAEYTLSGANGSAGSQSHSFDFNGTHFVALNAPTLGSVHPSLPEGIANLAWLDSDLKAARAAGARWIVVYMHADLFSSEQTSAMTTAPRRGLGDILQRYGVNLVLSGGANSYERTRALRGDLTAPSVGAQSNSVVTAKDGVVFVRAGSGGRTAFADWPTSASPNWSAFRNNTRAVYLSMTADGSALGVVAYALDASGKRTVIDSVSMH